MPYTIGYATRAGWRVEPLAGAGAWPAATAATVQALLPALELGPNDGANTTGAATVLSGHAPVAFDLLSVAPAVQLPLQLRYAGLEAVWACALGFMAPRIGATLLPETLAAGAYRHVYESDVRLGREAWHVGEGWRVGDGLTVGQRRIRRATLALDMGSEVWECLSTMVGAWTLSAEDTDVTLALDLVAHSLGRASAINTLASLQALAPPSAPRARFDQLVFRIKPFSAVTPLGGGDVVDVTSWAVRVDNQLAASFGPRTGTAPEEYERSQGPQVTLTFVPPRHSATTWQQRWLDRTVLMADAVFTGPLIGATGFNYQCTVSLPALQVSNAQLGVSGPGTPPETVQCLAVVAPGVPAGLPTTIKPTAIAVQCVTSVSTHPLLTP